MMQDAPAVAVYRMRCYVGHPHLLRKPKNNKGFPQKTKQNCKALIGCPKINNRWEGHSNTGDL